MNSTGKLTRRTLLKTAVVATPLAMTMTGCATASREAEQSLRASDPVARALAYYPDTREVPADNPLAASHDASQKCSNCVHSRGNAGSAGLECPMFPGRTVSEDGWCSIWAQA
jgi:hypothetical protein